MAYIVTKWFIHYLSEKSNKKYSQKNIDKKDRKWYNLMRNYGFLLFKKK